MKILAQWIYGRWPGEARIRGINSHDIIHDVDNIFAIVHSRSKNMYNYIYVKTRVCLLGNDTRNILNLEINCDCLLQ